MKRHDSMSRESGFVLDRAKTVLAGVALALTVAVLLLTSPIAALNALANEAGARAAKTIKEKPFTIYMALWRGCEDACRGFVDYIEEHNIPARVIMRDAKTDKSVLPAFVQEVKELAPDLLVTWGTNVTSGMLGPYDAPDPSRYVRNIPSIFMIVADPVEARITRSLDYSGRDFVTGTNNRVPEIVQLKAMLEYRPFKRFGIIYNEDELNAKLNVEVVRHAAAQLDLDVVVLPVPLRDGKPRKDDLPYLVQEAADRGVEFLYIGSSSFLLINADTYTESAIRAGIPVASSYEGAVKDSSALLAITSKYALIGRLAGLQAKRILVDKIKPGNLPIAALDRHSYLINMKTAEALELYPPMSLLGYAEIIDRNGQH